MSITHRFHLLLLSRLRRASTLFLCAAGCAISGGHTLLAQVAPPRSPTTAPSPPDAFTVFTEGTYPQPDARRTPIYYSRPAIKSAAGEVRKIWGALVPWDKVWCIGANQAALLISQSTLQFGDITIPASAPVTLFMLPAENGPSKLIINKQIGQSGLDYDEKQDLGRVDLRKDDLTQTVDCLTIAMQMTPPAAAKLSKSPGKIPNTPSLSSLKNKPALPPRGRAIGVLP